MKWYPNIFQALSRALEDYDKYDIRPEYLLRRMYAENPRWGARDRRFVRETLYEIIRRRRLYEHLAAFFPGRDKPEAMLLAYSCRNKIELPDFLEVSVQCPPVDDEWEAWWGYQDWFLERIRKQFSGESVNAVLRKLDQPALPVIRINTLKIAPQKFKGILRKKGYDFREYEALSEAVIFNRFYRLTETPWYAKGWFEMQDISSQLAGKFIAPEPGQTVVDACAGAGGKTLQLAALMKNKGEIFAFDIEPQKLRVLSERVRRAGVKNIAEIAVISPSVIQSLREKADILVLDAPCSGSGTYRRKPYLKWQFNTDDFLKIIDTQRQILDDYITMLKPGGHLIYITCSVLEEENEKQVKDFLDRHKSFTFVSEQKLYPPAHDFDGFYMAKLKKE